MQFNNTFKRYSKIITFMLNFLTNVVFHENLNLITGTHVNCETSCYFYCMPNDYFST